MIQEQEKEKNKDSQKTASNRKHSSPAPDEAGSKIAYQNKDITSKVLAERFHGKTFHVLSLIPLCRCRRIAWCRSRWAPDQ